MTRLSPPARRPGTGARPGRWGAYLAVRIPPVAFVDPPVATAPPVSRANREHPEDVVVAGGCVVSEEVRDREYVEAHAPAGGEVEPATDAGARAAGVACGPAAGLVVGDRAAVKLDGRLAVVPDAATEAVAAVGARAPRATDGLVAAEHAPAEGQD